MAYEQRDNSGTLFPNDKGGVESRPDFKGDIKVGGVLWEISGWWKNGKRGEFISVSVSEKRRKDVSGEVPATQTRVKPENAPRTQQARPQAPIDDDFDDDIPF